MAQMSDRHAGFIVVIGPQVVLSRIRCGPGIQENLLLFESAEAFDRWRARAATPGMIEADVAGVLADLGLSLAELPYEIQRALRRLGEFPSVPRVRDLVSSDLPARTLYRRWRRSIDESPLRFLARVRLRHAVRLMQAGWSLKESAFRAGYSYSAELRRALLKGKRRDSTGEGASEWHV